MAVREMGGYLEFERFGGELYHNELIALNCGRGALAYLVELRGIRTVWLPDLMCGSVPALFRREGVEVRIYAVGEDLLPDYSSFSVGPAEWMLLMDYYGQLQADNVRVALDFSGGKLVIDETQGFFRVPWPGADTVYTCRKWFGVSDGAYLATSDGASLPRELPQDESHARMGYLLGRLERPASEFFAEASENNNRFAAEPAKSMSPITENILRAVDYKTVRCRRDANWEVLDARLSEVNGLRLRKPDGAFMYPLYLGGRAQEVRKTLIADSVYIPVLWPDVERGHGRWACRYSDGVLPLPVDQRYGIEDMEKMLGVLGKCMS